MDKSKAWWIETDGTVTEVIPNNGKSFDLKELQGLVRGEGEDRATIDIQRLPERGGIMVINDNGKLIGLEENEKATAMWKENYPIAKYPLNNDELVVGNVIVCPSKMVR